MASYYHLKQLIESGSVTSMDDWFRFIDQKKFIEDTGIKIRRLQGLRRCPHEVTIDELVTISSVLDIDPSQLGEHLKNDFLAKRQ